MSAIGNAIKGVVHGIEGALKGVGEVAKGVLTLDFGKAAKGIGDIAKGSIETATSEFKLSPAGLAASTLLDSATKKAGADASAIAKTDAKASEAA